MHDSFYVRLAEPAVGEDCCQALQVRDGFEVRWRLFGAKASVEIGTDPYVPRVASELTDMIDVQRNPLDL